MLNQDDDSCIQESHMNQYIVFFQVTYGDASCLRDAIVTAPSLTLEIAQATKIKLLQQVVSEDFPEFSDSDEDEIKLVYTAPWMLLAS